MRNILSHTATLEELLNNPNMVSMLNEMYQALYELLAPPRDLDVVRDEYFLSFPFFVQCKLFVFFLSPSLHFDFFLSLPFHVVNFSINVSLTIYLH